MSIDSIFGVETGPQDVEPLQTLSEKYFIGSNNSIKFLGLYKFSNYKLKIHIYREEVGKSYAEIFVFNTITLKWNQLWNMPLKSIAGVQRMDTIEYQDDVKKLLNFAKQIL